MAIFVPGLTTWIISSMAAFLSPKKLIPPMWKVALARGANQRAGFDRLVVAVFTQKQLSSAGWTGE